MSVQQRIHDLLNQAKVPLFTIYKAKKFFYWIRAFLRKRWSWTKKKIKRNHFNCLLLRRLRRTHKKTVRKIIKHDLSLELNSSDYTVGSLLENKIAPSNPNIGSLKTAIGEEWNKISKEFILKVSKSFRSRVDGIIKKCSPYWVNLQFYIYLLIFLFIF